MYEPAPVDLTLSEMSLKLLNFNFLFPASSFHTMKVIIIIIINSSSIRC